MITIRPWVLIFWIAVTLVLLVVVYLSTSTTASLRGRLRSHSVLRLFLEELPN
jgi:hypothetical protein